MVCRCVGWRGRRSCSEVGVGDVGRPLGLVGPPPGRVNQGGLSGQMPAAAMSAGLGLRDGSAANEHGRARRAVLRHGCRAGAGTGTGRAGAGDSFRVRVTPSSNIINKKTVLYLVICSAPLRDAPGGGCRCVASCQGQWLRRGGGNGYCCWQGIGAPPNRPSRQRGCPDMAPSRGSHGPYRSRNA